MSPLDVRLPYSINNFSPCYFLITKMSLCSYVLRPDSTIDSPYGSLFCPCLPTFPFFFQMLSFYYLFIKRPNFTHSLNLHTIIPVKLTIHPIVCYFLLPKYFSPLFQFSQLQPCSLVKRYFHLSYIYSQTSH